MTYKDAVQSLDDINGDGVKEVVIGVGGGNEMVYVLSGKDGKKLWEAGDPVATADGDINGIRTDKDYNGDGRMYWLRRAAKDRVQEDTRLFVITG